MKNRAFFFAFLFILAATASYAAKPENKMMEAISPNEDGAIAAYAREQSSEFDISDRKDYVIQCPPELRNQVTVNNDESKSWVVGGEGKNSPLKGARLYVGPVSETTLQKYNELTAIPEMNKEKAEFRQTWSLDEQMYETGILLVCDYAGNNHYLMSALPRGIKRCEELDIINEKSETPPTVGCK